jgi:hypothetical protein
LPQNGVVDPAELGEAEQLLWKAFPRGEWVDLRVAGKAGRPVIRAEVIAALLLGAESAEPGSAAGIRLRGAAVTGRLDLSGGTVSWPLMCDECGFDAELVFIDTAVQTVGIVNSELPGFDGTRMRLDGILDLSGSAITGPVRLEAASVTGMVNLTGASISCQGERALVLSYATISGKLNGRNLIVEGGSRAVNCRVAGQLFMAGARLANPGGAAFFAGGLEVGGGAFFSLGFHAIGEFRLIGAVLSANLSIDDATFENPGAVAVNLERATLGSLHGDNVTCRGQLSMPGAQVNGDLNLPRAVLQADDGEVALNAERAQVGGTVLLSGVKALGEINLRSIQVGARIMLVEAELRDRAPHHAACRLSRAQVTADVFCHLMTAEGRLRLFGSVVGGTINLTGATLSNPAGKAVEAENVRAQELVLQASTVDGGVDLSHAAIGVLRDDPASWPAQLYLDGLTYQALDPALPAAQRLSWLDRDPRGHQPQPYEQLAAHYNAAGQPVQARDVLYAREKIQHNAKGLASRALGLLQDITVGYGYRPRRALGWLALLLTTGSIVFSVAPPPSLQAGSAPHFNGIIYTLDLMLPVVNLGQKNSFNPGGPEQWLSYILIAAGWTLATTVAAGAARVLRKP